MATRVGTLEVCVLTHVVLPMSLMQVLENTNMINVVIYENVTILVCNSANVKFNINNELYELIKI